MLAVLVVVAVATAAFGGRFLGVGLPVPNASGIAQTLVGGGPVSADEPFFRSLGINGRACATCHVYVEPDWVEKTGQRAPMEEDMLDFAFDVRDSSRLSCQIKVSDALDGLRVRVPEKQF